MAESPGWPHGQPSHTAAKGDSALGSAVWLNVVGAFLGAPYNRGLFHVP